MNPALHDRIRRLTDEAVSRLERARDELRRRRGEPPRPGDLHVFRETARFDVQWAVLERRRDELLVVPADDRPWVGSADVAVPADAPCGALTLRCGFATWLDAAAFDAATRTGALASGDLDRARGKLAEIERGAVVGSARAREVDGEAEYEDWAEETLAWAQAALSEAGLAFASGVYGDTGAYLSPPVRDDRVAAWARDERIDPDVLRLLEHVHHAASRPHLGVPDGVDPRDPRQAGWGVVFHAAEPEAARVALAPLVAHRREHTGAPVKVLEYRDGEDWREWLARHGVAADEVRPEKVPYYLLLVGPPTRIPFELQSLLAANHAVGRLSFEDPDGYRHYAESVIAAETSSVAPQARDVVFFGPRHPSDPLTRLTAGHVVRPLIEGSGGEPGVAAGLGFAVAGLLGAEATRDRLLATLRERSPALVLGAGHGVVWPPGHRERRAHQGDLVCQGWPGPGGTDAGHRLGAADLPDGARVHGAIVVLLTSYSAGTGVTRDDDEPFVARLPQRLLSHPRGGALAVVGRIDAAWGAATATRASAPLRAALAELLEGSPVGHAVRALNQRHAALTIDLDALVRKEGRGARVPEHEIAAAWVERHQARGVVVLGDPAARLRVEALPEPP